MKALDTKGLHNVSKKNVIAAAGYVTSAAKRGRLGPYGNRVQVTYDSESGAVWATEDTRSTYTVDTASQVSAFFKSPIKAQKLLDRLAEAWEEKQENRKWMAEINGDFD